MDYVIILIAAVFVNNIVLSQFLGICPFLGVSNKVSTSIGMSGAVLFVMTIATSVTYLLHQYVLVPAGLKMHRSPHLFLRIQSDFPSDHIWPNDQGICVHYYPHPIY